MKKFFYLIFFACFFLNSMICPAAEEGLVELDLTEADMPKEITLQDQINMVWEVGSFFEKNYPGDMIFDDLQQGKITVDESGVYRVERARFVAAKCMRLYDCRGHVYDD